MRVSSDQKNIRLIVTGSHNLSKAAWGCEEKGGTQVHIRSYEELVVMKVDQKNLVIGPPNESSEIRKVRISEKFFSGFLGIKSEINQWVEDPSL